MPSIPVRLGGDGINYWVPRQERYMSCTAACVRMVAYLTRGRRFEERFARNLIDVAAGMAKDGAPASPVDIDWRRDGAEAVDVKWTLERFLKLTCFVRNAPRCLDAVENVGPDRPAILGVKRDDGRHAVVVANQTKTHLVILDPAAGLALLERQYWEFGDYMPSRVPGTFAFGEAPSSGPETKLERVEPSHWGEVEFLITTQRT